MRSRSLAGAGVVVAVWLSLGWVLSLATTRVRNWFVMTDELYYERLAISVAQTGSLLPRLHGEVISNVNQLYPVLLSTVYGDGNVPASLEDAHRLNAFLITSAAIPVYLLARRVGLGLVLSVAAGAVAAAVPWVVLSSFLLTEVVAYPAACWAFLALVHAVERESWIWDGVALLAIVVAVLARTQLLVLLLVLAAAVLGEAALTTGVRDLWRSRRPLVLLYGALAFVVLAALVSGHGSRLLGSYAVTAENVRLDLDLVRLVFEHLGVLALALALLPFVVAVGWLIDRLRGSAPAAHRALALVALSTLVLMTLQVASFDQRFGSGLVKDRYLFYVVPPLLVGLAAAAAGREWPRWWALVIPAAVAALGFLWMPLDRYEKLNVDTPIAMLNDGLVDLATSVTWTRAMLILAAAVCLQALLLARVLVPWRPVAVAVACLAAVALPLEAAYAFERLFRVNGTNGLPVTLDQGVVFNWVDRTVGPGGRVTVMKYPAYGADWWADQGYWWDVEFWNESAVRREADMSLPGASHWSELFDPRTGTARGLGDTGYALSHSSDVRFRLAGRQIAADRDAYIVEPERPWRADWLTRGIQPDGWTRPGRPAEVRVFAQPGQRTPVTRFVTLAVKAPEQADAPVTIRSNVDERRETIPKSVSVDRQVRVCVPAGGSAVVSVETPVSGLAHRDPTKAALTGEIDRPVGVLLRWIALADEIEPVDRCPPS